MRIQRLQRAEWLAYKKIESRNLRIIGIGLSRKNNYLAVLLNVRNNQLIRHWLSDAEATSLTSSEWFKNNKDKIYDSTILYNRKQVIELVKKFKEINQKSQKQ